MGVRAVVAATCAVVVGCAAHQQHPAATPLPTPSLEGRTSVRVLESEFHQPQPNAMDVRITPAFASDQNKLPEYPRFALKAGCELGVVPIRLFIGRDGNVATTSSVPNHPVADDQCHGAFWAATVSAVQGWRFSPAYRQTPKPGPDLDGDGKPDFSLWEQEAVMIYLDFEFTFRVVEGKGQVLSR